jgi:hypothetical protein
LPIRRTPEGYLETIPELVVEVRSKNDTLAALEHRAQDYLLAGAAVVWVVDPISRNVSDQPQRDRVPPGRCVEDLRRGRHAELTRPDSRLRPSGPRGPPGVAALNTNPCPDLATNRARREGEAPALGGQVS